MSIPETTADEPELWVGIECTVNRIGNQYFDQLERSGHASRVEDLERLADLGVRTIRYPVLWERTAPSAPTSPDWAWADERLKAIRRLELRPIVGLVHHGSGPRYTNLLDPLFGEKLANYASQVAHRYPWITDYTPINEPLTTARFSCLYGHWYPHLREALSFARAVLAQCKAVILSMRAIREVNSSARLVQTEDVGKVSSTPTLAYQAEFENERRWLTFDLLCGRIDNTTSMWGYFRWLGVEPHELEWFLENSLSPDVLGINHYITSERFLDERVNRYPSELHGGNGQHRYADVEAVRVCSEGVAGAKAILREAWQRYGLPLAITEAHLGCTREEQLRWLAEVWDGAAKLRASGVDVRAVTAWAAFGAFDWNSLVTRDTGFYEAGAFDLRAPAPRPTAISHMIKKLAAGESFDHPALDGAGWWRRMDRFCYPPVVSRERGMSTSLTAAHRARPILITGATGTLGGAFARICEHRGLAYRLVSRREMDVADERSVAEAIDLYEPWAIVNAAGYVRVDDAEREIETCRRENTFGAECLARTAAARQLRLVTFSSDLVFDGLKKSPYVEGDATSPLSVYGQSKTDAEKRVLNEYSAALVIRTSAFFGPWDKFNFVHGVLTALASGSSVNAADDIAITATYVPDLVHATLDLLIDGEQGIWHLANPDAVTWAHFACMIADRAGLDSRRIRKVSHPSFNFIAPRPLYSALASERGNLLPPLDESLDRYFRDIQWRQTRVAAAGLA